MTAPHDLQAEYEAVIEAAVGYQRGDRWSDDPLWIALTAYREKAMAVGAVDARCVYWCGGCDGCQETMRAQAALAALNATDEAPKA